MEKKSLFSSQQEPSAISNASRLSIKTSEYINRSLYTAIDVKNHVGRKALQAALTTEHLLPTEITASPEAIDKAHALLDDGYGFIVPYNHFSKREPLDSVNTLLGLGGNFVTAEYLSPLAWHQQKLDVKTLSKVTGISLAPIVTSDTIEESKNFPLPTFKDKITNTIFQRDNHPKKILPERHGLQQYIDRGGEVLSRGGIVIIAPQGGRRNELGKPHGRAVELLIRNAEKKGMDKLCVWPMGISLSNTEVYDETTKNLNLGQIADIKLPIPQTLSELREEMKSYNNYYLDNTTIDEFIFMRLATLLPPQYTKIDRAETI